MKKALLLAPMSSVHERFNIANIGALSELGYEIHLAANFSIDDHAKSYKEECQKKGIIIHGFPFSRHSLKKNIKYVTDIKQLLRNESFDIVHAHTETGGLLLRLSLQSNHSSKYIYTAHGMSFYKGSSVKSQMVYKPIEKFICSKMDRNIAINDEEYEYLKSWNKDTAVYIHGAGFDIGAIETALPDTAKKSELGIPVDRKMILSVGELNENKNHQVIIKAISGIPAEKRPTLLICGEGEKRDELIRLAEQFHCRDFLFMPGYRYDMPEIFKSADLFVFPSYHEGLSFSLMQAMAAELPVICTRIRGNTDLIDENKGGYFCSPDDPESVKKAIVDLMDNEIVCKRFGDYNHRKVQLFALQNVKRELRELYSEMK